MRSLRSVLQSGQARTFALWLEAHVPFVREWHRVAYEEHFFRVSRWERLFYGVYPDFASAEKAIPKQFPIGYDNPEASSFLGHKLSIRSSDYPILFWLRCLLEENDKVFDFGGYLGISYWSYAPLIDFPASLSWTVYDVPAVVEKGKEMQLVRPSSALSYTTDFSEAAKADILLASGSLQFCVRDLADYLSELKSLPKHLLINETPMVSTEPFVTLQNMGPALAPYRILQKQQFIDSLTNLHYRVVDQWQNDDFACVIPFEPDRTVRAFTGMYLRRD
jgi:putative methyltransferase (TIGR04325 family)